jgi:hypothetical protein
LKTPTCKRHLMCAQLPAEEREEPNGGNDLMAFFGLSRLYTFSQSKFVPEPYLRGLAGDTMLRRWAPLALLGR